MSETLRVTLEEARLTESEKTELSAIYRVAAMAVVPPATVASMRLILRNESYGVTVEPFVSGASLQALTTVAKKRMTASDLLSTLVACAFFFSERVGVLHNQEDSALPPEREEIAFDSIRGRKLSRNVWYSVAAASRWFHFARTEAKLLRPLKLPSGDVATHYLREFWVRAVEEAVAKAVVADFVSKDSAVVLDFGAMTRDARPPFEDEAKRVSTSGRVYFRGETS